MTQISQGDLGPDVGCPAALCQSRPLIGRLALKPRFVFSVYTSSEPTGSQLRDARASEWTRTGVQQMRWWLTGHQLSDKVGRHNFGTPRRCLRLVQGLCLSLYCCVFKAAATICRACQGEYIPFSSILQVVPYRCAFCIIPGSTLAVLSAPLCPIAVGEEMETKRSFKSVVECSGVALTLLPAEACLLCLGNEIKKLNAAVWCMRGDEQAIQLKRFKFRLFWKDFWERFPSGFYRLVFMLFFIFYTYRNLVQSKSWETAGALLNNCSCVPFIPSWVMSRHWQRRREWFRFGNSSYRVHDEHKSK